MSEILFYGGTAMTVAAMLLLLINGMLIIIRGNSIKRQLTKEYGKPWTNA